jgi:hypothetical protein
MKPLSFFLHEAHPLLLPDLPFIGIMRALDERHSVDLEAGYVRHLEWHRQAKDPFGWYSYSISASIERQRWIIYATFGHTAAELSNPVSPAEDWRDASINLLPHVQFTGSGSLASILDEHAGQVLPEKANGLISKMTVETLSLRPNMLVNVTPQATP